MRIQSALGAALIIAAGFASTVVWADDLRPPLWRGLPRTTLAEWEFMSPVPNPTIPDGAIPSVVGNGGGGGPLATMQGPLIHDSFDGDGAWIGTGSPSDPPGQIILDIPNWIDNEPLKLIQIQMTVQWYDNMLPDGSTEIFIPHVVSVDSFDPNGPTSSMLIQVYPLELVDANNNTWLRRELWKIRPNPDYERIVINVPVDTIVDQIVVDTISFVPEPGTMVLGLIAAMGTSLLVGRWRNCKN